MRKLPVVVSCRDHRFIVGRNAGVGVYVSRALMWSEAQLVSRIVNQIDRYVGMLDIEEDWTKRLCVKISIYSEQDERQSLSVGSSSSNSSDPTISLGVSKSISLKSSISAIQKMRSKTSASQGA